MGLINETLPSGSYSLTESDWPAVLLIADDGPNLRTASGILLYRLLSSYPPGRLRIIESPADRGDGLAGRPSTKISAPLARLHETRFHRVKRSLSALGVIPDIDPDTIKDALEGFEPDVVLSMMQSAAYYNSAYCYARLRGLPLVLIIHDINEDFEPVFHFARRAVRRRDTAVYRYASNRLCVSPEMERLNAQRYGVPGEVMYPNRSEQLRPRPFEESAKLKTPGRLTVSFVGNPNGYGYGHELARLIPAFRATGSRLLMFGNPPGPSSILRDAQDCCEIRGFLQQPEDAWKQVQTDSDAVIMPYANPAGGWARLYGCHFPSKLPEYLALGMPVIVSGPEYATGVKWALGHRAAVECYCGTDLDGFSRLLVSLRDNAQRRCELAKLAPKIAAADFDPIKIKHHFFEILRTAAYSNRTNRFRQRRFA